MHLATADSLLATAPSVLVVVAHPDDETIAAGGWLMRMSRRGAAVSLLQVTDGAPDDAVDARRLGLSRDAYATLRRAERQSALAAGGVRPVRILELGIVDQQAHRHLTGIAAVVEAAIDVIRPAVLLTHAYEGGHPDHDSTAWAVRRACATLVDRNVAAPPILEAPLYHARCGSFETNSFLDEDGTTATIALDADEVARKQVMLSRFASQAATIAPFRASPERFRHARPCDFRAAPHAGVLWYERQRWGVTGAEWRRAAAEAAAVGLHHREGAVAAWR